MKLTYSALFALLLLGSSLLFTACGNDDPTPSEPLQATIYKDLPADPIVSAGTGQPPAATGKFTLFSFASGKVIANADSASNKWDIGFRATRIIFNGGISGPGQAAASLQTGLFDDMKTVSDTVNLKSDNAQTLALSPSSGKGWYNYNPTTNIISSIPGRVVLLRTADGKFAKMEILSYYKDAPTTPDASSPSRYYTFRYVYQPDGSRKLD